MVLCCTFTLIHFKDGSGNIITTGTVYLQLTEMYKAGDMICNRTTTFANGQMLASGGEITMTATMNGQPVYANKYGIGFNQTGGSIAPMALFYGTTSNADSIATWTQSDTTQIGNVADGTTIDSSSPGTTGINFYTFDSCTNFIWANCDWFYNTDSPKVTVSVILPDTTFNPYNTQLFLALHNITGWGGTDVTAVLSDVENTQYGSLGSASYTAATNTMILISEGNKNIVPAGLSYELVVITNKNGSYYYYEQSGTVPDGGIKATAAMASETQGDIVSRLQGL